MGFGLSLQERLFNKFGRAPEPDTKKTALESVREYLDNQPMLTPDEEGLLEQVENALKE